MESHNNQKKIAVINDMTGFGRCALTVAIPVISVMKVQCCPVPTSILSNHTAFESCFIDDYTDKMGAYIGEWKKLGLEFSGIYSGFLGSEDQIRIVTDFFKDFKRGETQIIIDPVMGDHGKAYRTYTPKMCEAMKGLVTYGNILTPNVTEACILTDTPYKETWTFEQLCAMAQSLSAMGPEKVVITGVPRGGFLGNFCYVRQADGHGVSLLSKIKQTGRSRCGTGDLFASIIAADAVNGVPFAASVRKASKFIKACIVESEKREIPVTDGVCFEDLLYKLR